MPKGSCRGPMHRNDRTCPPIVYWMKHISRTLEVLAGNCSRFDGSSAAVAIAMLVVLVWALTGSFFHYSETRSLNG